MKTKFEPLFWSELAHPCTNETHQNTIQKLLDGDYKPQSAAPIFYAKNENAGLFFTTTKVDGQDKPSLVLLDVEIKEGQLSEMATRNK